MDAARAVHRRAAEIGTELAGRFDPARLAAQAGDGEIVISASTRQHLGSDLPVENLGVRPLKNVDTPLRLYRLCSRGPRSPRRERRGLLKE